MPGSSHGWIVCLMGVGEERAPIVQSSKTALIRCIESRHIVIAELVDDDRNHQLGLCRGRRIRQRRESSRNNVASRANPASELKDHLS